jgi:aminoglycoside phosphotransferase (APT) family kinase protein
MTVTSTPPGIPDPGRLEAWISENLGGGGPAELTGIELIAGGRSNLTYRLTLTSGPGGPREIVLRRPPLGHVLPTAHDMSREFRVLSGLNGTPVPVARPLAICADTEIIGAPFYLMAYVPGVVLRTRQDTSVLTEAQAAGLSEHLADMLAAIHGTDLTATGLSGLGKGAGYLRRQLDRWQRQWELSKSREMPGYDELVARLGAAMPPEGDVTLVHGDFRLDNVLVTIDPEPRIAAVVDWEMATLGDPLADLGLTLVYWTEAEVEQPGSPPASRGIGTDGTTTPGFMTRAEFAAAYAERTGRDVSRISYYTAFGYFKLAVVVEGIYARFLKKQTVGEGFDQEGLIVPELVAHAHEILDADGSA